MNGTHSEASMVKDEKGAPYEMNLDDLVCSTLPSPSEDIKSLSFAEHT
jgi:hypothetical protein